MRCWWFRLGRSRTALIALLRSGELRKPRPRQFACPCCGALYKPRDTGGRIKAHHIWYFAGSNTYVLSAWPASAEEAAVMGLQELLAGVEDKRDEIARMDETQLMEAMSGLVDRHAHPAYWQDFEMTQAAKRTLSDINASRTRQAHFRWDHLEGKVFKAGFVRVTDDMPIMSELDSKILFSMVVRHSEQVAAA